ncbi:sigma-70 family RNA polymerase sigma factor [Streptomyces gamaensis]|uniref:RNA polymerase sigma factor n=1 Tax=Streptomyces gamaensis TaxID=1763542 RepID=A0ABW0ZAF0_9ACTN
MTDTSAAGVELVEAARGGDPAARGELVAVCLPLVHNIVGRALRGHADVDDVVQETLIRVIGGLEGLEDPGRFRAWLAAITMNQIRAHWRRQHGAQPVEALPEPHEVRDPGADFVDVTILRLGLEGQRREAVQATRWLDDVERAVLSLWWAEAAGQLTRREVVAALGLPAAHTAVRVQRAKFQLDVARTVVRALSARPRCAGLGTVLRTWDGVPSPLWRKRVARHVRGCGACGGLGSALVPAEGLLAGLGLVPVGVVLLERVLGQLRLPMVSVASRAAYVPPCAPAPSPARTAVRAAAAVAALALLAGGALGGGRWLLMPATQEGPPAGDSAEAAPVLALNEAEPVLPRVVPRDDPAPAATPAAVPVGGPSADHTPAAPASPSAPASRTATTARPAPAAPPTSTPEAHGSPEQEVVDRINAERVKAGCAPLRARAWLAAVAQHRSGEAAPGGRTVYAVADVNGALSSATSPGGSPWGSAGLTVGGGLPGATVEAAGGWTVRGAVVPDCSLTEIGVGADRPTVVVVR